MISSAPRHRWAAAVLAGLTVGAFLIPGRASAQPPGLTTVTATDIVLLNAVRRAGLWQIPAGQIAAEKGQLTRVQRIGAQIAAQHVELDRLVIDAANRLGVRLPDQPNSDQNQWLRELQNASGSRFDQIFVDRLRAAHGRILTVVGAVRAATRNDVIRDVAQQANDFVINHMIMLESTGLVRYAELPPTVVLPRQDESLLAKARASVGTTRVDPMTAWMVLLPALTLAAMVALRIRRRRAARPPTPLERRDPHPRTNPPV